MALLDLSMVTAAIVKMGVEAGKKKLGRQEAVVRILKRLKLGADPPPDDFDAIYIHALIEYGVFKPEPILNFLRNEFIRDAFRQAFYKNDPCILDREAEAIIHWNEETGKLGHIDYDPRREFAAFTAVFNDIVDRTRTPAEVKRDQKIDDILASLASLPTLDDVRREIGLRQQAYEARQFLLAPSGEKLKVFISSTMAELRDLRAILEDHLSERGLDAWVYEKRSGARPGDVVETSLAEVEAADVYVGLFWQKWGPVTAQEYLYARKLGKPCFVYLRDRGIERDKELEEFLQAEVRDLNRGVTYAYFDDALPLVQQAADDILAWLVRQHRELTAQVQAARVSQDELARLQAEVDRLQATSREPLPAGTTVDFLAQQLRGWFKALDYQFDGQVMHDDHHFQWVINVPARRGYDRILVYGVSGEATRPSVLDLRGAVEVQHADEGWLVAPRRVSPTARGEAAKPENPDLFCYTLDELVDDQVDFTNYIRWLEAEVRRQHIDTMYIPLAATKEECDPATKEPAGKAHYDGSNGWLEGYIDRWLDDPSKEHVSILGEFGTGKSWFCLRHAWEKVRAYQDAKNRGTERPRFPLVIPLRDYAKALDVETVIAGFFFKQHNIRLTGAVFDQLNRMGRLLLIFDGFDEMAARVDRQQMVNNFWQLARVVVPGAKAILTCRTEHFPTAMEARALLSAQLLASTARITGEPPQFEVLELEKLTDDQIRQVLTFRTGPDTVAKVMGNPDLLDLLHRPVMVDLVLEAIPDVEAGKPVDLPRVFLYAATRKMERDMKAERTFTSLADKLYFMCEVSWEMLSTDRMTLNYRDFPETLHRLFPLAVREPRELDHWHYDMMGQTLLVRNAEGDYTPGHRSLAEFFAAYKLAAELGALPADFLAPARAQRDLNTSAAPMSYTWSGYFARELDEHGAVARRAPLRHFVPEPSRELDPVTLGPVLPERCWDVAHLLAHIISGEWIQTLPCHEQATVRSSAFRQALVELDMGTAVDPFDVSAACAAVVRRMDTQFQRTSGLPTLGWHDQGARVLRLFSGSVLATKPLQVPVKGMPRTEPAVVDLSQVAWAGDNLPWDSAAMAPLMVGRITIGTAGVFFPKGRKATDADVRAVEAAVAPLGSLLSNMGWFREAWQQQREHYGPLLVLSLASPVEPQGASPTPAIGSHSSETSPAETTP